MKLILRIALLGALAVLSCSKPSTTVTQGPYFAPATNPHPLPIVGNEANILPVTVGSGYFNEPTISVKVCEVGSTTNCVVVNNLLLDTGSFGLRVFKSVISSLNLSSQTDTTIAAGGGGTTNPLAECFPYADGTADWGPVVKADIYMGNAPGLKASNIAIQKIDSTYVQPTVCSQSSHGPYTLDVSPSGSGYNGVIGVGVFTEDCGTLCSGVTGANTKVYFQCDTVGGTCTGVRVPLANQITNPAAGLPAGYNNGVALQLNAVSSDGGPTGVYGYLVLGIGNQTNNTPPSGVIMLQADANANFKTTFNGMVYNGSFIDSGTNTLSFPQTSSTPDCGGVNTGFDCPSTIVTMSAIQGGCTTSPCSGGSTGSNAVEVPYYITNALNAIGSGNTVFNDIGTSMPGGFDWGLPFFLGRTVYVGFDATASSLGTGPYWAF